MVPASGALKLSEDRRETGQDETAIRYITFYPGTRSLDVDSSVQSIRKTQGSLLPKVCQNSTLSFYSGYA
jgi:hypothetical protein